MHLGCDFYSNLEHGTEDMKISTEGFHNSNLWNIQYNKANKAFISVKKQNDQILLPITGGPGSLDLPIVFHVISTNSWANFQVCRSAFQCLHYLFICQSILKKWKSGIRENKNRSICVIH